MISPVFQLECITPEDVNVTFYYHYEKEGKETTFRVNDNENIVGSDFFELTVIDVDENTLRIDSIEKNTNPALSRKGIPDVLIPEIARVLKKSIISSTSKNLDKPKPIGEKPQYRTVSAEKYWKRLQNKGLAQYDSENDIYTYNFVE